MLKALCQFLENQSSLNLVVGSTLVCGPFVTGSPDTAVAAVDSGSSPSVDFADQDEVVIQFLGRSKDYTTARDKLIQIEQYLRSLCAVDLPVISGESATHIATIEVLSGPTWLLEDEQLRQLFSMNVLFRVQAQ